MGKQGWRIWNLWSGGTRKLDGGRPGSSKKPEPPQEQATESSKSATSAGHVHPTTSTSTSHPGLSSVPAVLHDAKASLHNGSPQPTSTRVLLLVRSGLSKTYRLSQIPVTEGMGSKDFFWQMRTSYYRCRGFWARFKVLSYSHCEFYHVSCSCLSAAIHLANQRSPRSFSRQDTPRANLIKSHHKTTAIIRSAIRRGRDCLCRRLALRSSIGSSTQPNHQNLARVCSHFCQRDLDVEILSPAGNSRRQRD